MKDGSLTRAIEKGLHATAHASCVGRDGTGATRKAKVVGVKRIENLALWKAYWHRKDELVDAHRANNVHYGKLQPPARPIFIVQPPDDRYAVAVALDGGGSKPSSRLIDPSVNECFLYHGTSAEVAEIVAHHGFDERVSNLNGLCNRRGT